MNRPVALTVPGRRRSGKLPEEAPLEDEDKTVEKCYFRAAAVT